MYSFYEIPLDGDVDNSSTSIMFNNGMNSLMIKNGIYNFDSDTAFSEDQLNRFSTDDDILAMIHHSELLDMANNINDLHEDKKTRSYALSYPRQHIKPVIDFLKMCHKKKIDLVLI